MSGSLRILAIDDEQDILDSYRDVLCPTSSLRETEAEMESLRAKLFQKSTPSLSQTDFDLVTCKRPDEALETLKEAIEENKPFAMAFVDIRMPLGEDGLLVAKRIRSMDSHINIMIVTGFADLNNLDLAHQIPPADKLFFIQKPLHSKEVRQFASALSAKWQVETQFQKLQAELEQKVKERTADLAKANKELRIEIKEREQAEKILEISREELRNLSAHLQSAREGERTSIAREIHDELGQILTACKIGLSDLMIESPQNKKTLIEKTKKMSKLIDISLQTVRRISSNLRPSLLDDLGIIPAIEWHAEEFQDRMGIKCVFNTNTEDIVLDKDRSTVIYRIFQETLTNVARHANATIVKASLQKETDRLILIIKDNGKGITEKDISSTKSFGIIGIRERVHFVGGDVKIVGVRGKGTTITVSIPLLQK